MGEVAMESKNIKIQAEIFKKRASLTSDLKLCDPEGEERK